MNINGKKILVTGGGSGYGKGIAGVLAKCGAEVWITGRREEKLKAVAAELGVKYCCADVANPSDWDKVISLMGGIDVLVNNAGWGGNLVPVAEQRDEDIIATINTNLTKFLYFFC